MKTTYIKNNKEYIEDSPYGAKFLYNNKVGNVILFIANKRWLSSLVGGFMNTKLSKLFIKNFIKDNNIDISIYEKENYRCFNDFFTRKIKKEYRKFSNNNNDLIAPADSKLLVYKIDANLKVNIKNTVYTVEELLKDKNLAKEYQNGYLLIFRLCVTHYHRYSYIDNGTLVDYKKINGLFHTVGPIAFKKYKVLKENQREYSVLITENFDKVVQMEVGALMVGKIKNYNLKKFEKGEEKGYFLFGGSTVVLFIKDIVKINEDILKYSKNNIEVEVCLGQTIGKRV